jgi:hypothetical protein
VKDSPPVSFYLHPPPKEHNINLLLQPSKEMGFSSCEYVHPRSHFVDHVSDFTEMASKDFQDWESEEILNFKEKYFFPASSLPHLSGPVTSTNCRRQEFDSELDTPI